MSIICTLYVIPINSSAVQELEEPNSPPLKTEIRLVEDNRTANVAPGETGIVIFQGIISMLLDPGSKIIVRFSATDTWFSSVVSPASHLFEESGEKPFGVSVRAKPRTSTKVVGQVVVKATWETLSGEMSGAVEPEEGASANISISQFHKLDLECPVSYKIGALNDDVPFELEIKNRGNCLDTFIVWVHNQVKLEARGIDVKLSTNKVIIPEGENRSIRIVVNTPSSVLRTRHYSAIIMVRSENDTHNEHSTLKSWAMVVRVPGSEMIYTIEFAIVSSFFITFIIIIGVLFWRFRRKRRLGSIKGKKKR
jgi:hypothetical protein